MIRNSIIGLSILFFALSGIITFKASGIPAKNTSYQNAPKKLNSKDLSPKSEDNLKQLAKELAANRALVEELKATIAKLKDTLSNKNKKTLTTVETKGYKKKANVLAVLGGGTFSSGQIVINEDLINTVKGLVRDIRAYPDHRIIIEGHTDNTPVRVSTGKQYRDNKELSILRAKTVAKILEKNGMPHERISVIGYGDTRPIATNKTGEGRAKNRRVEIKLVPEDKES